MKHKNSLFKLLVVAVVTAVTMTACLDEGDEIALVKLGSVESEYILEVEETVFEMQVYANGPYHIENDADWLTLNPGEIIDGMVTVAAKATFNDSFKRRANVVFCSDVDTRRDTVAVKQKSLMEAFLEFDNLTAIVPGAGGEATFEVQTNVSWEEMTVDITYKDEENTGWIQDMRIIDSDSDIRTMLVSCEQNVDEVNPRVASVHMYFIDGWEDQVSVTFNLLQCNAQEMVGRMIEFDDFIENYALGSSIDEYVILEGYVVSNKEMRNAGEPDWVTDSDLDYTPVTRTIYLESLDGKRGISILANYESDNILNQFDRVQILFKDTVAELKYDPERCDVTNFDRTMIVSAVSGTVDDLPVKERAMNALTDDDIYTYVKLVNVELPVRKGSLMMGNEGYGFANSGSFDYWSKCPTLMRDINGDSMYLLTNPQAMYRNDGTRLPYGSGKISGVIVHERVPGYEWENGRVIEDVDIFPTLGYVGRYLLRPQVKSDIWGEMNDNFEDGFSALLCEYRFYRPSESRSEVYLVPTYGTNGYLTHTYQEKYTGDSNKQYTQNHVPARGEYCWCYIGPIGRRTDGALDGYFNRNFGNKNGCGIILDLDKEGWYSGFNDYVSYNPDGTVEWCGPYAKSTFVSNSENGWVSNEDCENQPDQINYLSTDNRGKGTPSRYAYVGIGNYYWWDYDTNRPYAWLLNVNTMGLSGKSLSLQLQALNTGNFYCPRYWKIEWALTDSQAEEDDGQWSLISDFTMPDLITYLQEAYWCPPYYKSMDFPLPSEILGHENVWIRICPKSDVAGSYESGYDGCHMIDKDGDPSSQHSSTISYLAIRYNK